MSVLPRLLVPLVLLAPSALPAQSPHGLRNHFRIVASINSAPQELREDSGWVAAGPLVTPGATTNSVAQGCFSQGTCTATSECLPAGRVFVPRAQGAWTAGRRCRASLPSWRTEESATP